MKYIMICICMAMSNFLKLPLNGAIDLAPKESINWDSTLHWKIYKLAAFKAVFRIPADSLSYIQSTLLNDDSVHQFLNGVSKSPVVHEWMGCYLVSFELPDHTVRKVIISHYGGFFYTQQEHSFYKIEDLQQKDWLDYLSNKYVTMSSNTN